MRRWNLVHYNDVEGIKVSTFTIDPDIFVNDMNNEYDDGFRGKEAVKELNNTSNETQII